MPRIGWKATAGILDVGKLISELQSALSDEVEYLKKLNVESEHELYDGQRISAQGGLFIYRFQSSDLLTWRRRRRRTQLKLTMDGQVFYGVLDSCSKAGVNIALEVDAGEFVERTTVQDSSFELLQNLHDKLERVKTGETGFNSRGGMKLFGFIKPDPLPVPIQSHQPKTIGFSPNIEQQLAIRRATSQEVTFIWGPPGTGKTKTLGSILAALIGARRSVLLVANTNRAVDEILKKFVENPENEPLIDGGKIIRLGIPDDEDENLNRVLIERVVEKRTAVLQKNISDLQSQIESSQNTAEEYSKVERQAAERIAQKERLVREHDRAKQEIESLQNAVATASSTLEQIDDSLSSQRQLLEKARTTNVVKRLLLRINREQIEADITSTENRRDIARLELQSLQKRRDDSIQEANAISDTINQYRNEIEPSVDSLTTLKSLHQRISELHTEVENKKKLLGELQTQVEKARETAFNEALVVGSTIARACLDPKILKRKFDTLIVDEASMAPLPNVFFLAGLCSSHYVMSGDFRQLAPIARCRSEACQQWLRRSIFSQAGIVESVNEGVFDDDRLVMLREQYRMHPNICALVSDAVYERKLKTPESVSISKEALAKIPPFEGRSLILCDTTTTNPLITRPEHTLSRLSPYSARLSSKLAVKCIEEGEKNGRRIEVGVVTPYREQAKLISKMLEDEGIDTTRIVASTIHRFQGGEKDCIILDLVEGEPLSPGKLTEGAFKESEAGRLVTVAVSRAMGKFILVGNSEYIKSRFSPNDAIRQLLERIAQTGEIIDSREVEHSFRVECGPDGTERPLDTPLNMFDQTSFYPAFIEDLRNARSRVVIFSPFVSKKRVENLLPVFREVLKKNVLVYVVTRSPEYLKDYRTETAESLRDLARAGVTVIPAYRELGGDDKFERFHYKVAVIDNSIVYYGSLNILSQSDSSESMMAFTSKKTVAQLIRVFHISEIIKDRRFGEISKGGSFIMRPVGPPMQPAGDETLTIPDMHAIAERFGVVRPGKDVRKTAEQKLCKVGRDLGFDSYVGYEVPDLLNDGRNRFISVIWKKGKAVMVAFQVRRKAHSIDVVTSLKDRRKLDRLMAQEKYIVNVSETTGQAHFHRVTNWDSGNLWAPKPKRTSPDPNPSAQERLGTHTLDPITLRYKRAYAFWTDSEDQDLISEYQQNLSISEIAKKHQRQTSAIRSRLRRLSRLGLI